MIIIFADNCVQVAPQLYSEAELSPFQTEHLLENLVAPGIEPGPLGL
jgi:hypothetical protein